jgi:hypothetical protein
MPMNSQLFEPKSGGWARLNAKLAAYDREQNRELILWRGAAAAMVALVVLVASHNFSSVGLLEDKPANPTIEMPGMPANVHYYWVIQ